MTAGGTGNSAFAAFAGKALIAIVKIVAAGLTGSAAMFAAAVHSAVDAGNRALPIVRPRRGGAEAIGPGREGYFAVPAITALLCGLGAGLAFNEGFQRFANPTPIRDVGWAYAALALALLVEGGAWVAGRRAERDRPEVVADAAGLAGLALAAAGVVGADRLGWLRADGVAALAIGAVLLLVGLASVRGIRSLAVGEPAGADLAEALVGMAGRAAFVEGVNEVRTMEFGPMDVLVNISVDARDHLSAGRVEAGVSALEAEIRQRFPKVSRVFIEIQSAADSAAAAAAVEPD